MVGDAPVYAILQDAKERAHEAGAKNVEEKPIAGAPINVLLHLVEEVHADLLVIGNVGLNSVVAVAWIGPLRSLPQSQDRRANRSHHRQLNRLDRAVSCPYRNECLISLVEYIATHAISRRRESHALVPVLILAQDHHITVINAATGEVLRDFTLDPTRAASNTETHPKTRSRCKRCLGTPVNDVPRHHMVGLTGFEPATT